MCNLIKLFFLCAIGIINGLEENHSVSEKNHTTTPIITKNEVNQTDPTTNDSNLSIPSLFVINSNNKQNEQTFILSRNNDGHSKTDNDTTLNINDKLKLKITQVIGVDKIPDEQIDSSVRFDAQSVVDNLSKHFNGRENKLRSVIVRKRKINRIKLKNEIRTARQLDNLEMIPFTLQDVIIPGESNIQRDKIESMNDHPFMPPNHAAIYKPILNLSETNIQNNFSPYNIQYLPMNHMNISLSEDVKTAWNIPSNNEFNMMNMTVNFVKNIFAKMFNRLDEPLSKDLHIVGPIPKPLPRHFTFEPYENQLQLPKEK